MHSKATVHGKYYFVLEERIVVKSNASVFLIEFIFPTRFQFLESHKVRRLIGTIYKIIARHSDLLPD